MSKPKKAVIKKANDKKQPQKQDNDDNQLLQHEQFVFSKQDKRKLGKSEELSFVVTRKGDKPLEINDIKNITNQIQKFCNQDTNDDHSTKYMLRVLSNKRYTLKPYEGPLQLDEYDDYFENKVKDPAKFSKFYEAQIIIKQTKK